MAFSDQEKERIRYHMGYPNLGSAPAMVLNIPVPMQTMFLVELAMNNVLPVGEDRVRTILTTMDCIEEQQRKAMCTFQAAAVGNIKLRGGTRGEKSTADMLEDEYVRWANRLADQLGAPLYPGASRFNRGGVNVKVINR
jgi:hypothetical protein